MKINNSQLNELVARRCEISNKYDAIYFSIGKDKDYDEDKVYEKLLDQNRLEIFVYLKEKQNEHDLTFEDIFYALDMCGYEPSLMSSGEGTWCVNPEDWPGYITATYYSTIREAVYVYIDKLYDMITEEIE